MEPKYKLGSFAIHPKYGLRNIAAIGFYTKEKIFEEGKEVGGKVGYCYQLNYCGTVDGFDSCNGGGKWWTEEELIEADKSFKNYLDNSDKLSYQALKNIL